MFLLCRFKFSGLSIAMLLRIMTYWRSLSAEVGMPSTSSRPSASFRCTASVKTTDHADAGSIVQRGRVRDRQDRRQGYPPGPTATPASPPASISGLHQGDTRCSSQICHGFNPSPRLCSPMRPVWHISPARRGCSGGREAAMCRGGARFLRGAR